jgi:hypothetical protein
MRSNSCSLGGEVAELPLSPPPDLGPNAKYPDYREWLLDNFYCHVCSYCLQQYRHVLQIDHYIPHSFQPALEHDARNLLLSCQTCGRQKSDYHPAHAKRRRLPLDRTGFAVIDVRREDLAHMFFLESDGSLTLHTEVADRKRVAWNVALLRLDLHAEERARLLEKLRAVEDLRAHAELSDRESWLIDILERDLAERLPMIRAFDLPLSSELRARLQSLVAART